MHTLHEPRTHPLLEEKILFLFEAFHLTKTITRAT